MPRKPAPVNPFAAAQEAIVALRDASAHLSHVAGQLHEVEAIIARDTARRVALHGQYKRAQLAYLAASATLSTLIKR